MKPSHCIFELIYFARPDSQIFGQNVYLCRKRLGHSLAREYRPDVDFVMPFPDSGNYAALGYAEESGLPFEMGMIRNHYVGRTFIQPSQAMRDFGVRVKLNPVQPLIEGKRIVIVEDSIIRGTTSRNRVRRLRESGAKETPHGRELPADPPPLPLRDRFFGARGSSSPPRRRTRRTSPPSSAWTASTTSPSRGWSRPRASPGKTSASPVTTAIIPCTPPKSFGKFCFEGKMF